MKIKRNGQMVFQMGNMSLQDFKAYFHETTKHKSKMVWELKKHFKDN